MLRGGIHVISLYLKDSEGLSEYNLRVLQEAAVLALTLGTPWIMAGDWNITPEQLQAANWLGVAKGTVFATELPTCHCSTYDYFVVSHNLAHAVVGVQRIDDAGLHPHHPCRVLLRGDAKRKAVRKLTRAPKVHATLPHGPAPKPPYYDEILGLGGTSYQVARAMGKWYELARTEWTALAGYNLSHKKHKFHLESAVGSKKIGRQRGARRGLARACEEVRRCGVHRQGGAGETQQQRPKNC